MATSPPREPFVASLASLRESAVAFGSDVVPAGGVALALEVHGLTKAYPGTVALREFEFTLRSGEVRALLGKNGAGKSTFVEILSGTLAADSGRISVAGRPTTITSPLVARAVGIATVHQEPNLFPALSVAENLTLGRATRRGVVSAREQRRQARAALDLIQVSLPLDIPAGNLTIRDQQLVAIARALSYEPHVLILDEPTSALSTEEVDHLLGLVARLAQQGVAVIYVSHRLDEIPRVAHSVTVLRDGALVGTLPIGKAPAATIVEMMLGHVQARSAVVFRGGQTSSVALSVRDVRLDHRVNGVSLDLHDGEVLGLWGMPGAGRSEFLRGLFGLERFSGGQVFVRGVLDPHPTPRSMIHAGVAFSPDDRKREGLVLGLSVAENLVMASPDKVSQVGVIAAGRLRTLAWSVVRQLAIKTPTIDQQVQSLSGGNQQKVVIGKWLAADSRILLMDEPTRGVDVEAKAGLYGLLRQLSAAGRSVLLAPTELEELFLACDRIVVLKRGRIVGEVATEHATPAAVMALAMGG